MTVNMEGIMERMNDASVVKQQYANASNLNIRISIHDRYSTNKQGFGNNLGSITGGMTSTPALGTLISVAGTGDVAAAYASTYPVALVLIVLFLKIVVPML